MFQRERGGRPPHRDHQRQLADQCARTGDDFGAFWRDFEWMGVQRQLKVLGIFARLCHRDGKAGFVADMPRVMGYLRGALQRYRALEPLLRLIDELEHRPPVTEP